jgi:hypothetical protein
MVSITLRVLSRPEVTHLSKIYQSLGLDYDERVLPSIGNEVLKAIVAQFDAAELITQREVVCVFVLLLRLTRLTRPPGLLAHKGGSAPTGRGVQHQTRGCFYHPFDLREGSKVS